MTDTKTYLENCFRDTFPHATMIRVILDTSNETIIVIVVAPDVNPITVYEMIVSSDDDEYRFVSMTNEFDTVEFPIPTDDE